jgi:cell division protein FtsQ
MSRSKNTAQKRPQSGLLFEWGRSLLLVGVSLALIILGVDRLRDPAFMPVRLVTVDGEMRHLDRANLERAVTQAVDGGFFSVDLEKIRRQVEALPWVDSVSIRRVWPGTLRVKVVEQQPLARWGDDALINQQGVVFRPDPLPPLPGLTRLIGEDRDAPTITREYQRIRVLLATVGLEPVEVRVDARQAWQLRTREGLALNLGRKQIMRRLTRFVRIYPSLTPQRQARLEAVDLRYTNGFAATWKAESAEQQSRRLAPPGTDEASKLAGI